MTPVLDVVIFQVSTTFGARRLHRSAFAKLFQGLSGSERKGAVASKKETPKLATYVPVYINIYMYIHESYIYIHLYTHIYYHVYIHTSIYIYIHMYPLKSNIDTKHDGFLKGISFQRDYFGYPCEIFFGVYIG